MKISVLTACCASLLIVSATLIAKPLKVTYCFSNPPSNYTQSQLQGIQLSNLRARIDSNFSVRLHKTTSPNCVTLKKDTGTTTINLSCNWFTSNNQKSHGERGNCTFSNIRPIKLHNSQTSTFTRNKPICIITSVIKSSRTCGGSNRELCIKVTANPNNTIASPILFMVQKFDNTTPARCASLANNNI